MSGMTAACWLAVAAGVAAAAPLGVVNPSFEDTTGATVFNEFTFGPPPGWQLYDPGSITGGGAGPTYYVGTLNPSTTGPGPAFPWITAGPPDGNRVAIAFNFVGSGGQGEYGLQQALAATLQPNTRYTLQVEVINIASGTAVNGTIFNLTGFPGYRVDLLAGGVVIASDNNTLAGSIPEGEYRTSTVNFITGASHPQLGQALGIRLVNLNQALGSADIEVDFDHVRLDATPVPEPTSLALLAASAAAGLAVLRRRR
jgi:hypothetical protein